MIARCLGSYSSWADPVPVELDTALEDDIDHFRPIELMVHAWKEGDIEMNDHEFYGPEMIDIVLQSCVELNRDWICPTAVGTKTSGYHN
jgi:hypothetical protein